MAPLKRVRIRMYRGILGDCFLLRTTVVEGGRDVERSILIDCGVLQNVPAGTDLIKKLDGKVVAGVGKNRLAAVAHGPTRILAVLKDVLNEVGNRIDLLVITHEHYDHLSGFAFGKKELLDERVSIGRLWMAWTEDPKDSQARQLRARFAKGKQALAAAAGLAQGLGFDVPEGVRNAAALADFVGPVDVPGMAASGGVSTSQTIQMLKEKAGAASIDYLEPGQVVGMDAFGMRVYVLGPPRMERLLAKDAPSAGHAKEVYLTRLDGAAAAESAALARLALASGLAGEPSQVAELVPFAATRRRPIPSRDEEGRTVLSAGAMRSVEHLYYDEAESWRKIDEDWAGSIEALALKMDSDTNNTSLALAFELPDGQILLLPGDAQVGNWLSWHNQSYPHPIPKDWSAGTVTAEDLLRRTTFYKAGHHGSHNSTLKALGLERMKDTRLIAAIPVVEAVAAIQGKGRKEAGKGWKMPYDELYAALAERTKGRIVQGDGNPAHERKAFKDNPTDTKRPVKVDHDELWVELTFELA